MHTIANPDDVLLMYTFSNAAADKIAASDGLRRLPLTSRLTSHHLSDLILSPISSLVSFITLYSAQGFTYNLPLSD